jgi:hypothetical protein
LPIKLILDMSSLSEKIIVRRSTPDANQYMFDMFQVDAARDTPVIFLINNTQGSIKKYERFGDELLKKYVRPNHAEIGDGVGVDVHADLVNDDDNESSMKGDDPRHKYLRMLRLFVRHHKIASDDKVNKMREDAHAGNKHEQQMKKAEADAYLTK